MLYLQVLSPSYIFPVFTTSESEEFPWCFLGPRVLQITEGLSAAYSLCFLG